MLVFFIFVVISSLLLLFLSLRSHTKTHRHTLLEWTCGTHLNAFTVSLTQSAIQTEFCAVAVAVFLVLSFSFSLTPKCCSSFSLLTALLENGMHCTMQLYSQIYAFHVMICFCVCIFCILRHVLCLASSFFFDKSTFFVSFFFSSKR